MYVCMYIKFVKFEILFKLFCSRGEYVILWWFRCYELVLKQMDYEVLTMKVYVSWDFAFCISSVWYITSMSNEVEFNCLLLIIQFEVGLCDIYIYMYVCMYVCICVCVKLCIFNKFFFHLYVFHRHLRKIILIWVIRIPYQL